MIAKLKEALKEINNISLENTFLEGILQDASLGFFCIKLVYVLFFCIKLAHDISSQISLNLLSLGLGSNSTPLT